MSLQQFFILRLTTSDVTNLRLMKILLEVNLAFRDTMLENVSLNGLEMDRMVLLFICFFS